MCGVKLSAVESGAKERDETFQGELSKKSERS